MQMTTWINNCQNKLITTDKYYFHSLDMKIAAQCKSSSHNTTQTYTDFDITKYLVYY